MSVTFVEFPPDEASCAVAKSAAINIAINAAANLTLQKISASSFAFRTSSVEFAPRQSMRHQAANWACCEKVIGDAAEEPLAEAAMSICPCHK